MIAAEPGAGREVDAQEDNRERKYVRLLATWPGH